MILIIMTNLIIDKVFKKDQLREVIKQLTLIKLILILLMMNQELFKLLAIMNKQDNLNLILRQKL
jgi:hypothetical protein